MNYKYDIGEDLIEIELFKEEYSEYWVINIRKIKVEMIQFVDGEILYFNQCDVELFENENFKLFKLNEEKEAKKFLADLIEKQHKIHDKKLTDLFNNIETTEKDDE